MKLSNSGIAYAGKFGTSDRVLGTAIRRTREECRLKKTIKKKEETDHKIIAFRSVFLGTGSVACHWKPTSTPLQIWICDEPIRRVSFLS